MTDKDLFRLHRRHRRPRGAAARRVLHCAPRRRIGGPAVRRLRLRQPERGPRGVAACRVTTRQRSAASSTSPINSSATAISPPRSGSSASKKAVAKARPRSSNASWRALMLMLQAYRTAPADTEALRQLQARDFGASDGPVALLELLPLPSQSKTSWMYEPIARETSPCSSRAPATRPPCARDAFSSSGR